MRVNKESEKAGLKTKIMASSPITSWQIEGERVEAVTDFLFLGSKITADGDCSREIRNRLLLGRKAMTNLEKKKERKLVAQLCLTLCDPMDCNPPGSSSHGIFQARMTNLDSILKSRDVTLPAEVRLVKAMVFPVVMYGCESWIVKKTEHQRIDTFELWCWRRLVRVPWAARRSNQSILHIHWKD